MTLAPEKCQNPDSFPTSFVIYQAPVPLTFDTDFFAALNPEDAGTLGGQASRLIQHLDEAMTANSTDESAVADFIAALLRALDFAPNEATIRTGKNFAFRSGREKRYAKADVCIVEGTNPLLIVQQDKSHVDPLEMWMQDSSQQPLQLTMRIHCTERNMVCIRGLAMED